MVSRLRSLIGHLFTVDPEERVKLAYLGIIFFLIIAGYTLAKDLKDTVFMSVVGRGYQPYAKFATMFILIPPIFLYSRIVDTMRRYQVLAACSAFFGLGGLIFAYYIGHPTIGIANTNTSWDRIFGWLFYFFSEGYSPFVVSVFWAFANSINSPQAARDNYGLMVSASKIGGMLSAGFAWILFAWSASRVDPRAYDVLHHQWVLAVASICLLLVPLAIWALMRSVPGKYLHGYEAAYKAEKQRAREHKKSPSMLAGLQMFMKYPYVLGIFGMVFFYEAVFNVVQYIRLGEAGAGAHSLSDVSGYLFKTTFLMHSVALVISIVGTRPLLRALGERRCLLIFPVVCGTMLLYFMFNMNPGALALVFITLKSMNFAFFWPVRESLYIPTVKEIKFKSKSWIDVFGTKFAKSTGSAFNALCMAGSATPTAGVLSIFFVPIILLWLVTAYLLGHRFDQAIARNEVIGYEGDQSDAKESAA